MHFPVENAKQPCADQRPSFKPIESFEENREHVLYQVLGFLRAKTHAKSHAVKWPGVLFHSVGERLGIALAQPADKGQIRLGSRRHQPPQWVAPTSSAGTVSGSAGR